MHLDKTHAVRAALSDLLIERGQSPHFGDTDSLFDSGRLDSLAAVKLLMMLESEFGLDLSDPDFEIARIDSLAAILDLVGEGAPA
ncbi:hypothetical protein LL06_03260 [Hoeflea sp. BAL378]|uniref:acyl carrier protein n=1 Tax=Hoeflea sp. BAL378 TaxID=1547437 RepID=UPI000513DB66|nr:phosphopantetheine-binding protein [Hoeflea sp. BAL378]KGF70782.1 hypothetical protein LL06_03260 [Hoeflea sp. BAL378]